ncbi:unnamed protein product [Amoebophrya sp. A120]|nr:unnamed protein product [Amoebophrya sp. A120]|eukprot:GSA120T00017996001.1
MTMLPGTLPSNKSQLPPGSVWTKGVTMERTTGNRSASGNSSAPPGNAWPSKGVGATASTSRSPNKAKAAQGGPAAAAGNSSTEPPLVSPPDGTVARGPEGSVAPAPPPLPNVLPATASARQKISSKGEVVMPAGPPPAIDPAKMYSGPTSNTSRVKPPQGVTRGGGGTKGGTNAAVVVASGSGGERGGPSPSVSGPAKGGGSGPPVVLASSGGAIASTSSTAAPSGPGLTRPAVPGASVPNFGPPPQFAPPITGTLGGAAGGAPGGVPPPQLKNGGASVGGATALVNTATSSKVSSASSIPPPPPYSKTNSNATSGTYKSVAESAMDPNTNPTTTTTDGSRTLTPPPALPPALPPQLPPVVGGAAAATSSTSTSRTHTHGTTKSKESSPTGELSANAPAFIPQAQQARVVSKPLTEADHVLSKGSFVDAGAGGAQLASSNINPNSAAVVPAALVQQLQPPLGAGGAPGGGPPGTEPMIGALTASKLIGATPGGGAASTGRPAGGGPPSGIMAAAPGLHHALQPPPGIGAGPGSVVPGAPGILPVVPPGVVAEQQMQQQIYFAMQQQQLSAMAVAEQQLAVAQAQQAQVQMEMAATAAAMHGQMLNAVAAASMVSPLDPSSFGAFANAPPAGHLPNKGMMHHPRTSSSSSSSSAVSNGGASNSKGVHAHLQHQHHYSIHKGGSGGADLDRMMEPGSNSSGGGSSSSYYQNKAGSAGNGKTGSTTSGGGPASTSTAVGGKAGGGPAAPPGIHNPVVSSSMRNSSSAPSQSSGGYGGKNYQGSGLTSAGAGTNAGGQQQNQKGSWAPASSSSSSPPDGRAPYRSGSGAGVATGSSSITSSSSSTVGAGGKKGPLHNTAGAPNGGDNSAGPPPFGGTASGSVSSSSTPSGGGKKGVLTGKKMGPPVRSSIASRTSQASADVLPGGGAPSPAGGGGATATTEDTIQMKTAPDGAPGGQQIDRSSSYASYEPQRPARPDFNPESRLLSSTSVPLSAGAPTSTSAATGPPGVGDNYQPVDVDDQLPRSGSAGSGRSSINVELQTGMTAPVDWVASSPAPSPSGSSSIVVNGVNDLLACPFVEKGMEDDKRWLDGIEYSLVGPVNADDLDRYPRIENWLLNQKVLGLDMKHNPDTSDDYPYAALLVFAAQANVTTGEPAKVLLLRTHSMRTSQLPDSVVQVLMSRTIIKALVGGIAQHLSRMQKSFGVGLAGLKDPAEIAREYQPQGGELTLRQLCKVFGFPCMTDKRIANTSDWEKGRLSAAQIRCAADDGWFSLQSWLKLEELRRNRHADDARRMNAKGLQNSLRHLPQSPQHNPANKGGAPPGARRPSWNMTGTGAEPMSHQGIEPPQFQLDR